MNVLFWINKNRINKLGEAPIILRVTLNKVRENIRTGIYVHPDIWDSNKQKIRGSSETVKQLNNQLQTHKVRLLKAYDELIKENKPFGCRSIVDRYSNKHVFATGFIEALDIYNKDVESKVGIDLERVTFVKYRYFRNKFKKFIKYQYNRESIQLIDITRKTITDLDQYLKSVLQNQTNTVYKTMQYLKRVLKYCRVNGLIQHDPFDTYQLKQKETHRGYLTMTEIKRLIDYTPSTSRLKDVKNVFLFQIFSGLAYSDVLKLNNTHIETGLDGKLWIKITRTKTKQMTQVPLLPVAESILDKYTQHIGCRKKNRLLPVISNQPFNRALKEIAVEVGIVKNLTSHLARHSFATTILLNNGIRIETVSKLLAHSNIKTTQIYAKLNELSVAKEMENLGADLSTKLGM